MEIANATKSRQMDRMEITLMLHLTMLQLGLDGAKVIVVAMNFLVTLYYFGINQSGTQRSPQFL
jgi:hypothetical protein